jgi:hypothetical protein
MVSSKLPILGIPDSVLNFKALVLFHRNQIFLCSFIAKGPLPFIFLSILMILLLQVHHLLLLMLFLLT